MIVWDCRKEDWIKSQKIDGEHCAPYGNPQVLDVATDSSPSKPFPIASQAGKPAQ